MMFSQEENIIYVQFITTRTSIYFTFILEIYCLCFLVNDEQLESVKSLSTKGPGKRDTCHFTDFSQTFTVYEA